MEHHHEDNAHFENVAVHNSQNLMENLQFGNQQGEGVTFDTVGDQNEAIVGGGLGGIGCVVDNAGCKFEEHIERGDGDDDELKYVQEKHQSEKQHHYDLLKTIGNGDGPGHNIDEALMMMNQMDEHHLIGNGGENAANGGANVVAGDEIGDDEEVEIIKNDGDFSTTSNATTSTTQSPGDAKDVVADLLQVEMKIEAAPQQPGSGAYMAHSAQEELDEEEQSSLATNGTSSLSENQLQPQATEPQPFGVESAFVPERPVELNFDHHSMLNPEAKEFVPSFGSNPASPTLAAPVNVEFGMRAGDSELVHSYEEHAPPHPTSNEVARHIFGEQRHDDDFVAQSPHKERCVDMEAILLPGENEFEHEAAKRPHELEKEEMLLGEADSVTSDAENLIVENDVGSGDLQDLNRQSPASFIDHGPETSVDLDSDIATHMQPVDDVMKQSIYVENTHNASDEQIEHLLNTVQPLPTECESSNVSFSDEKEFMQQMTYERDIFNTETMENIAQMNLQNDLNSHRHTEDVSPMEYTEQPTAIVDSSNEDDQNQQEYLAVEERSFLMDTSNPLDSNNVSLLAETEASFDAVLNSAPNMEKMFEEHNADVMPPQTLFIGTNEGQDIFKHSDDSNITPSPHSTEEKHLVEETKEAQQLFVQDAFSTLGHKMNDMHLTSTSDDGNLAQMEPAAQIAAAINENATHFSMPEREHELLQGHEPEIIEPSMAEQTRNEQIFINEQIMPEHDEYPQMATEAFEQHEEIKREPELIAMEPTVAAQFPDSLFANGSQLPESILTNTEETVAPQTIEEDASAAVIAAATATAIAGAVGAVAVATKKTATIAAAKKPTTKSSSTALSAAASAATKTKSLGDVKKQVEVKKSTVTATTARSTASTTTARPRTAPIKRSADKPAGTASSTTTTTTAAATSASGAAKPTAPRKTFMARPAPKTTTAAPRATTAPSASKISSSSTIAARPASATARSLTNSTTTVRKTVASTNSTTGVSSTKSRLSVAANGNTTSAKPSTLGLGANAKPKNISPRATLTSQLRKTSGSSMTAAKSPTKPIAPGAHELTAKVSGSSLASRTKTTGSNSTTTTTTTTTTAITKRFVARPAPKFNATSSSSTTTTTTRASNGVPSATSKTSVASKRLSSPSKTLNSTKLSPTKSTMTTAVKSPRAKETSVKSAKELKQQQDATKVADLNTNGTIEKLHLNGNGVHHDEHEHALNDENIQHDAVASPNSPNSPEVINLIDA